MSISLEKKLLSTKETSKILGISERTLWSITAPRGPLVRCKIKNRVLYSQSAIDQYIRAMESMNDNET